MSVFIWVSSLPVPFCSKCIHLQASEMVLFVTRTIANVLFYCAMALHVQFLPMNFLFFCVSSLLSPSRCRWFQVVPARSRWFQLVPDMTTIKISWKRTLFFLLYLSVFDFEWNKCLYLLITSADNIFWLITLKGCLNPKVTQQNLYIQ